MRCFKSFTIAAVTSLSLAVTPMQAAAGPDGEDIAAALAGIAILGLIAKAASDKDDDRAKTAPSTSRSRFIEGEFVRDRDPWNATRLRSVQRATLPERCVRYVRTSQGTRAVYGQRCLNQRYQFAANLPDHCQRRVRTDNGTRTVFGARCLRREGWRVPRW